MFLGWRPLSLRCLDSDGLGVIRESELGLAALEFEVFEMGLVALIKISRGAGALHAGVSSRNVAE